jgi:hypothetical protein
MRRGQTQTAGLTTVVMLGGVLNTALLSPCRRTET